MVFTTAQGRIKIVHEDNTVTVTVNQSTLVLWLPSRDPSALDAMERQWLLWCFPPTPNTKLLMLDGLSRIEEAESFVVLTTPSHTALMWRATRDRTGTLDAVERGQIRWSEAACDDAELWPSQPSEE